MRNLKRYFCSMVVAVFTVSSITAAAEGLPFSNVTLGQATPSQATSGEATSGEATSGEATTAPATTAPATTAPATTAPTATVAPTKTPVVTSGDAVVSNDVAKATVKGIKNKEYTGKAVTLSLKVTLNGKTLKKGTDYTVSYKNNKNIGKATVTIKGKGNYTGKLVKTFNITKKTNKITKTKKTSYKKVKGTGKFKLTGIVGNGKITYKSSNKKVATVNSKGYVTMKGYGKVTIKVTAAGTKYYKKTTISIKLQVVNQKPTVTKAKSTKKKVLTTAWKRNKSATGYQVQYSTSKNFKTVKSITVKSNKKTSCKITKLKSKKKYYVRVRAYKTANKSTVYSTWSTVKSVKVK